MFTLQGKITLADDGELLFSGVITTQKSPKGKKKTPAPKSKVTLKSPRKTTNTPKTQKSPKKSSPGKKSKSKASANKTPNEVRSVLALLSLPSPT